MLFVGYPKCSTCQKAQKWLGAKGYDFKSRDIKQKNPSAEEIKRWHEISGLPLKRFYNTSGLVYKAENIKEKIGNMTEQEQYNLLATDGMLVKRPILVLDNKVLVGFKEAEWEEALQ